MGLFNRRIKIKPIIQKVRGGDSISIAGLDYKVAEFYGEVTVTVSFETDHPITRPRLFTALFLRMIGKKQ